MMRKASPSLPGGVYVLAVISLCVAVGFGVIIPVLPELVREFDVTTTQVGAVISAFALMRLAMSPLCPLMIRGLGARNVLILGLGIVAVSSAFTGLSETYLQLLLLRAAGGIGSVMFTVAGMTILFAVAPPAMRGRASALYQGGFLIGGVGGPVVGGVLGAISLRAPFFFYAGTLVVAAIVAGIFLPSERKRTQQETVRREDPISFRLLWRDRRYRVVCLFGLAQGWNMFGVRTALIPLLVTEVFFWGAHWTAVLISSAALAQMLVVGPAGVWVDRRGRKLAMIMGGGAAAVSLAITPVASWLWAAILIHMLYGAASALLGTASSATLADIAGSRSGKAVAGYSMFSDVGAIAGPLVAGAIVDQLGFGLAFTMGAALMAWTGVAAIWLPRNGAAPMERSIN